MTAVAALRIFSCLPDPRIRKATIAARLNGVELEVVGARPAELRDRLWDFEARPPSPADRARPAGAVSAGRVGIFESNSIARAVTRLGEQRLALYGEDAYEASRIDSSSTSARCSGAAPSPTCWRASSAPWRRRARTSSARRRRWSTAGHGAHPAAAGHFARLAAHPAFAPDAGPDLDKPDSLATRTGARTQP